MPRTPRITTTVLHVIVRGNGKQILFENLSDYMYFLRLLKKCRDETGIVLLAYCLMNNHVHLLIRDEEHQISLFMKKVGISYAMYFNRRYEHVGHVFQGRFLSENVTSEAYLFKVFRYILKNPEKAYVTKAWNYPWSSIHEYGKDGGLCDSSIWYDEIGDIDALAAFLNVADDAEVMEYYSKKRDDAWALELICSTFQVQSGTELQHMPKQQRDEALALLKEKGVSVRQLERLTGISRGIVQRV